MLCLKQIMQQQIITKEILKYSQNYKLANLIKIVITRLNNNTTLRTFINESTYRAKETAMKISY